MPGTYVVQHKGILKETFYFCSFILNSHVYCDSVRSLSLLTITMERFSAIKCPLWHKVRFTEKLVMNIICLIWSIPIIQFLLSIFVFNLKDSWLKTTPKERECHYITVIDYTFHVYAIEIPLTVLPVFMMVGVYVYIWYIVRKIATKKRQLRGKTGDATVKVRSEVFMFCFSNSNVSTISQLSKCPMMN